MKIDKLNILVVDDISFYRSLIVTHLDLINVKYEIYFSNNVKSGIKHLEELIDKEIPVHLVVSDFHMPENTGADLTKMMRSNDKFKDIPLIILTSDTEIQNILDCLNEGADSYLFKPWKIEDLIVSIDTAFKRHNIKYVSKLKKGN